MLIKIGQFVAADSRNGIPVQNLLIDGQRAVEVEQYPEGDAVKVFDRGNRSKVITFDTERQHRDDETAQRFATLHDEEVPVQADVMLAGTRGGWKLFLAAAGVPVCRSHVMGCRSYHSYQIVGGVSATQLEATA